MAIHGYRTTLGDGLHFTTDDGLMTTSWVGHGFQVTSGLQHGYHGVVEADSMVGLLWDQECA